MNDRFRNDRNRGAESGWQGNDRSGWDRDQGEDARGWSSRSREPRYSSDEDETRGSEWTRDQSQAYPRPSSSFGQRPGHHYGQGGNAGMYGGGSGGGYEGGRFGGGYGGASGTDYGQGGYGGFSGGQGRGGSSRNDFFDRANFGGERSFDTSVRGNYGGYQSGLGGGQQGSRGDFSNQSWSARQGRTGGGFAGRGPKGYTRTDERIREDVCDRLSMDDDVDATDITVEVQNGEVTLSGTVATRSMKHQAEDLAEDAAGVKDVHNQLRVTKGLLNEIKDKLSGEEGHYANTGTKDKPANGSLHT
jgi:hypothetical protein